MSDEPTPKRLSVSELPDDNLPKTAWRCPFKSLICNIFDGYCESCGKGKDEDQGLDYSDDNEDDEWEEEDEESEEDNESEEDDDNIEDIL
jgi:hypothetical protein